MEMKQVLYDAPYENPDQAVEYEGFRYLDVVPVSRRLSLEGQTVEDLFAMTPYYWKTPESGSQRLAQADSLDTEIRFDFLLYQRK